MSIGEFLFGGDLGPVARSAWVCIGVGGLEQGRQLVIEVLLFAWISSLDWTFGRFQVPLCQVEQSESQFVVLSDRWFEVRSGLEVFFKSDDRLVQFMGPSRGIFWILIGRLSEPSYFFGCRFVGVLVGVGLSGYLLSEYFLS